MNARRVHSQDTETKPASPSKNIQPPNSPRQAAGGSDACNVHPRLLR